MHAQHLQNYSRERTTLPSLSSTMHNPPAYRRFFRSEQNGRNAYTPVDYASLMIAKARWYVHENNFADAARASTTAIETDGNNINGYMVRAESYLKLNNKEGAKKDLTKAKKMGYQKAAEMLAAIQ